MPKICKKGHIEMTKKKKKKLPWDFKKCPGLLHFTLLQSKCKNFWIRKKLSEVNLKNAQLEKQLKVLKQAGLNDKERIANLQNKLREKIKRNLVMQI